MWKSDDEEGTLLETVVNWVSPTSPPPPQCSTAAMNSRAGISNSTASQMPPLPPPSPFSDLFPQELLQSSGLLLNQFDDVIGDSTENNVSDSVFKADTSLADSHDDVSVKEKSSNVSTVSGGLYRCTACKFSTDDRRLFMCHKRSKHAGEKTFSCPDCSAKFTRQYSLKKHVLQKHPAACSSVSSQALKYCPFPNCKFATKNSISMQLHKRSHQQLYFCKECNFRYTSRQSLLGHLTRHHGSNAALIGMGPSPTFVNTVSEHNLQARPSKTSDNSVASNAAVFIQQNCTVAADNGHCAANDEEGSENQPIAAPAFSSDSASHTVKATSGSAPSGNGTIDAVVGSVVATAAAASASPEDPANVKFFCDKCRYMANSLRRLYAHKLSAHRGGKEKMVVKTSHICPQCPRKFASLKRMLTHVKKIHSVSVKKEGKRTGRAGGKGQPAKRRPPPDSMSCDRCDFSTSRKRVFAAHMKSHATEDTERAQESAKYDNQQRKPSSVMGRRITPDRSGGDAPATSGLPASTSPPDSCSTTAGPHDYYQSGSLAKHSDSRSGSSTHSIGSLGDAVNNHGLFGQFFAINRNRGASSTSSDHCPNRRLLRLDLSNQSTSGLEEISSCMQGLQQANGALMQLLRRRENELRSLRSNVVELLRCLFPSNQAFHNVITLDNADEMVASALGRVLADAAGEK